MCVSYFQNEINKRIETTRPQNNEPLNLPLKQKQNNHRFILLNGNFDIKESHRIANSFHSNILLIVLNVLKILQNIVLPQQFSPD